VARSENRIPVEIPRTLYTELKTRAREEQRPVTHLLTELVYNGQRLTNQPVQPHVVSAAS